METNAIHARFRNAEQALSARMVAEYWDLPRLADSLQPDMFEPDNAAARACLDLLKKRRTLSLTAIANAAGTNEATLQQFARRCPDLTLEDAIQEFHLRRGQWALYQIAQGTEALIEQGLTTEQVLAEQERRRRECRLSAAPPAESGHEEFVSRLRMALRNETPAGAVEPPTRSMRELIRLHENTDFVILAARPGMGKSMLALNYLYHNAERGLRGAFFSLEMAGWQLYLRLWQMKTGVPFELEMEGKFSEAEERRLLEFAEGLKDLPFDVFSRENSLGSILGNIRRQYHDRGLAFAVVDYLQLTEVEVGRNKGQNREQVVSEISRAFKNLTRELRIPVIALSQLSRAVEIRGGSKRPQLSDLRESGSLEQDADIVMFLYRPEYYNILEDESGQSLKGKAEILIEKNRNGALGDARCDFDFKAGFYDTPSSLPGPGFDPARFPTAAPEHFTQPRREPANAF